MKYFYIGFFLVLNSLFISSNGQMLHYSQFFNFPLYLNPALTGVIDVDWRLINISRAQGGHFGETLNTISVSYDKAMRFHKNSIGLGAFCSYDNSAGAALSTNKLYISSAGMVQVSRRSFLGGGAQVGFVMRTLSPENFTYPEQYDNQTGGFNNSLPSLESFPMEFSNYLDVNMGVVWNYRGEECVISSGLALYHINQPKDYFLRDSYTIMVRTNWHGSVKYKLNDHLYILPQSYYTFYNRVSEFLVGSNVSVELNESDMDFKSVSLGVYIRDGFNREFESVIVVCGVNYCNWGLNASFDMDVSGLKTNSIYNHAFELTLIYQRPLAILQKISIPCIRY